MTSQHCASPQDTRVSLSYSSKEESGRHAVAKRSISPGELVLASAPYGLVMNPNYCPSALLLSSRATLTSVAPTSPVDMLESSGHSSSHHQQQQNKKSSKSGGGGAKAPKKAAAKHHHGSARGDDTPASPFTSPYQHALYGEGSQDGHATPPPSAAGAAAPSSASSASARWYTTQTTWCSVCFNEIAAGRWLCNRGSLAELAVDMSWEQEELERRLGELEAASAREDEGASNGVSTEKAAAGAADGEDDDEADGAAAAAFKKLKKPSKSAKTRKDGAVELKRKLLEKALAQREEIFYERQRQRRWRVQRGCAEVRQEGWEAANAASPSSLSATSSSAFAGAVSGCSGCGVLCYCSEACWRAYHTHHVSSGECAVLRALYPRLMSEYYATASGTGASAAVTSPTSSTAGQLPGSVVMPGDEPLHWARSTSEPRMLEFQSLLFSAVVLARAARAGYAANFASTEAASPSPPSAPASNGVASSSAGKELRDTATEKHADPLEGCDGAAPPPQLLANGGAATTTSVESAKHVTATMQSGGASSSSFSPAAAPPNGSATTVSVVIPKEVLTIRETRSKAGLTGTVEVLDCDPALRQLAQDSQAATPDSDWVRIPLAKDAGGMAETDAASPSASASSPLSQLCVRQPRYADMAQMETNLAVISKSRRSTYQRYFRAFTKRVLPTLQLLHMGNETKEEKENSASTAAAPGQHRLRVSESYFQRLCAAAQCNSFGVYDLQDHCIGFGMYPEASYFNHSCVPNICRVMHLGGRTAAFYALRPIAAGEPLAISYTDVEEQNSAERRRNLLETYRFFCMCDRCSGQAEGPTMAVAQGGGHAASFPLPAGLFERPLLLCAQCAIRGYLRPLPPSATPSASPASSAWSMAEIVARECTMCRSRVTRETPAAALAIDEASA